MKTLLTAAFLFSAMISFAQVKPTLEIVLEVNGTSNVKPPTTSAAWFSYTDTDPNSNTVNRSNWRHTDSWKTYAKPGGSIGLRVSMPLKKNFGLSGSMLVSSYATSRRPSATFTFLDSVRVPRSNTNPFVTRRIPYWYGFPELEERLELVTIDLPIGLTYNPGGKRFKIEAEMIPSINLKYSYTIDYSRSLEFENQEYTRVSRFGLSGGLGVAYRFGSNIEIGLRYRRNFTAFPDMSVRLDMDIPKMYLHTLGFQVRYRLPQKK